LSIILVLAVFAALFLVLTACDGEEITPTTIPTFVADPIDIEWLARVIASEAGSVWDTDGWVRCTDEERAAVGWTVVNRLNSGTWGQTIEEVATAEGQYAHGGNRTAWLMVQTTPEIEDLAGELLEGRIPDPTGGATHFFSPISMPKEDDSTTGYDIGGGLHDVLGIAKRVWFPSWTEDLFWVGELNNVGTKYYMFYKHPSPIPKPTPTPTVSPSPSPQPTSEGLTAAPLPSGLEVGDWSINVANIEREQGTVLISFAFRRVRYTELRGVGLPEARIIDDRGNVYTSEPASEPDPIVWENWPSGFDVLANAPVGFTWIGQAEVEIPQAAPIVKMEIRSYGDWVPVDPEAAAWPDLFSEVKGHFISPAEQIRVSKHLLVRFSSLRTRDVPWPPHEIGIITMTVTNEDYSPRSLEIQGAMQLPDGSGTGGFGGSQDGYFYEELEEARREGREPPVSEDYFGGRGIIGVPGLSQEVWTLSFPAETRLLMIWVAGHMEGFGPPRLLWVE